MANPQKQKGDRAEREAFADLAALAPDLAHAKPMRELGAGRKDDRGDVRVFADEFDDAAIQVKSYKDPASVVLPAAVGAERQRLNRDAALGLGLIRFPAARPGTVKWIAATLRHPADPQIVVEVPTYKLAISLVRQNPLIVFRVAGTGAASKPPVYLSSIERWIIDYRRHLDARLVAVLPAAENGGTGSRCSDHDEGVAAGH